MGQIRRWIIGLLDSKRTEKWEGLLDSAPLQLYPYNCTIGKALYSGIDNCIFS